MSSPATVTTTNVNISAPIHPSHLQSILSALLAGLTAADPIILTFAPGVGTAIEAGLALEPTVVQIVRSIKAAGETQTTTQTS